MNAPISVDLKNGNVTQLKRRKKNQNHRCAPKRQRYQQSAISGGVFQCFTIDGDDVNLHRRSKFSDERKEEVKGIRRKGACLRCRLLKRAVSLQNTISFLMSLTNGPSVLRRRSLQALYCCCQSSCWLKGTLVDGVYTSVIPVDEHLR